MPYGVVIDLVVAGTAKVKINTYVEEIIDDIVMDEKVGGMVVQINSMASITASATCGRSASPDNVLVGIS